MLIKRTYKEPSLRAGQTEFVNMTTVRKVLGQTSASFHDEGQCGKRDCDYCNEIAVNNFIKDGFIETFFSRFELLPEEVSA